MTRFSLDKYVISRFTETENGREEWGGVISDYPRMLPPKVGKKINYGRKKAQDAELFRMFAASDPVKTVVRKLEERLRYWRLFASEVAKRVMLIEKSNLSRGYLPLPGFRGKSTSGGF